MSELKTEVTSVAQEEKKSGQKMNLPGAEEMAQRASASFIQHKLMLGKAFPKLSSKQKNRVILSILDLPTDNLHVTLKTDEEKACFALGQRLITDRFILTQYHISREIAKEQLTKQQNSDNVVTETSNKGDTENDK